ncbi:MAG: thioredoxin domain-containing protein, partial [Tumebacillaceae bacterium]
YPAGHSFFLLAMQFAFGASMEIVLVEGDNVDVFGQMVQHVQQTYLPFTVYVMKGKEQAELLATLAPAHQGKDAVDGQSALYVCENFACQQPLVSMEDVEKKLG